MRNGIELRYAGKQSTRWRADKATQASRKQDDAMRKGRQDGRKKDETEKMERLKGLRWRGERGRKKRSTRWVKIEVRVRVSERGKLEVQFRE